MQRTIGLETDDRGITWLIGNYDNDAFPDLYAINQTGAKIIYSGISQGTQLLFAGNSAGFTALNGGLPVNLAEWFFGLGGQD